MNALLRHFVRAFLTVLVVQTIAVAADQPARFRSSSKSKDARTVNAERQLRLYHDRVAREKSAPKFRTPSGMPAEVGFKFDRSVLSGSTIYFSDDMESGANGWTTGAGMGPDIWHQVTSNANSSTHSWWPGIDSVQTYHTGDRVNAYLISPTIDLSTAVAPLSLIFTEWYVTEAGYDYCMVDITTDGGTTWTHLRGGYGDSRSGDSYGWVISSLDLSTYAGQQIQLRFLFDTGDQLNNNFPGWFVDNVVVFDHAGSIAGRIWYDRNQNGLEESSELGVPHKLVMATGGGVTITQSTTWDGYYDISLPIGQYQVSQLLPSPWVLTSSPAIWNVDLTTAYDSASSTAGRATGIDFGAYHTAAIVQGTAFIDSNRDSLHTVGEPPLHGWYIVLADSMGNWIDEAYVDTAGNYGLMIIEPGTYYVGLIVPFSWVCTKPGGTDPSYPVVVPLVDTVMTGFDFLEYQTNYATIGGNIFNDANRNGLLDEHETMVAGLPVFLDGPGPFYNSPLHTSTDTTGHYAFRYLIPGTWRVYLGNAYRWRKSYPDSFHTITVTWDDINDSVNFGAYQLPGGTIRGTVFRDQNRNLMRDSGEAPLYDWTVSAMDTVGATISTTTDTSGAYVLEGVDVGPEAISLSPAYRWGISLPLSPYLIMLDSGQVVDSIDYGAYPFVPGSISGTMYNDLNGNGSRDPGEPPLAGRQIQLMGAALGSTATDDTGHYRFDNLWSGSYQTRALWYNHWRQTYPPALQPNSVTLNNEEQREGVDFGVIADSSFNLSFRSFLPESIALAKDFKGKPGTIVKLKATGSEETFDFLVPEGGELNGLHVEFMQAIDLATLVAPPFTNITADGTGRRVEFRLTGSDTLTGGTHLIMTARGNKPKELAISKYWWMRAAESPALGTLVVRKTYGTSGRLTLPMPNAITLIDAMFRAGIGSSYGLYVGLPPGMSGHFVYTPSAAYVWKSLVASDKHTMHTGAPRCLGYRDLNDHYPMTKPLRGMPPSKVNNELFAEALALKVNLKASELWFTPPGFGNLIFRDTVPGPWNGMSIGAIAQQLDSAMSAFNGGCVYDTTTYFRPIARVVRMLNGAFSGPMDTLTWGNAPGLYLKPVRLVAEVPYLQFDSSFSAIMATLRPPRPADFTAPYAFALDQNFPNPFNPSTTISFTLPAESFVSLKVYNILGQEVARVLDHEYMDEGSQAVEFDGSGLASGIYFYRLAAQSIADQESGTIGKSWSRVLKMVLVK